MNECNSMNNGCFIRCINVIIYHHDVIPCIDVVFFWRRRISFIAKKRKSPPVNIQRNSKIQKMHLLRYTKLPIHASIHVCSGKCIINDMICDTKYIILFVCLWFRRYKMIKNFEFKKCKEKEKNFQLEFNKSDKLYTLQIWFFLT